MAYGVCIVLRVNVLFMISMCIHLFLILGHGVFTYSAIEVGTYIAEYKGRRINPVLGQTLIDDNVGQYIYFFSRNGQEHCIDAREAENICKFINDAPKRYTNTVMRVVDGEMPTLRLFAKRNIIPGEELRYTYDDEDPSRMWWRKDKRYLKPRVFSLDTPTVQIRDANIALLRSSDQLPSNDSKLKINSLEEDASSENISSQVVTDTDTGNNALGSVVASCEIEDVGRYVINETSSQPDVPTVHVSCDVESKEDGSVASGCDVDAVCAGYCADVDVKSRENDQ